MSSERLARISAPRISIVQARMFVEGDGVASARVNTSGYRSMISGFHDRKSNLNGYGLPWSDPKNNYWRLRFGPEYVNAPSRALVAGLMPLRRSPFEVAHRDPERQSLDLLAEVFWLPFAVGTVLDGKMMAFDPPMSFRIWSGELDAVLRTRIGAMGRNDVQLRDGLPADYLVPDPIASDPVATMARQPVRVMSALLDDDSTENAEQVAAALASGFEGAPTAGGIGMVTDRSAIAVSGGNVGVVLSGGQRAAARRLECLHHNLTTHLTLIECFLGLVGLEAPSLSADWYRRQAAMLLTQFYNRLPDPVSGTIYKTRVSQLWIDRSGAVAAINGMASNAQNPPSKPIPSAAQPPSGVK